MRIRFLVDTTLFGVHHKAKTEANIVSHQATILCRRKMAEEVNSGNQAQSQPEKPVEEKAASLAGEENATAGAGAEVSAATGRGKRRGKKHRH